MLGYNITKGAMEKSTKLLKSSALVQAYQKEYFMHLKERTNQGEPFVFADSQTPHEILVAMDIPHVVNAWWHAINMSKRLVGPYQELVDRERTEKGWDILGSCNRCGGNVQWARIMDPDQERQTYGG